MHEVARVVRVLERCVHAGLAVPADPGDELRDLFLERIEIDVAAQPILDTDAFARCCHLLRTIGGPERMRAISTHPFARLDRRARQESTCVVISNGSPV